MSPASHIVAGDGDDVGVLRRKDRLGAVAAHDLHFFVAIAAKPFDQDQVDGAHSADQLVQRGLRRGAVFVHQRPTGARGHHYFVRPGSAVLKRILAGLIDIEAMVRMFDGRYAEAAAAELGN